MDEAEEEAKRNRKKILGLFPRSASGKNSRSTSGSATPNPDRKSTDEHVEDDDELPPRESEDGSLPPREEADIGMPSRSSLIWRKRRSLRRPALISKRSLRSLARILTLISSRSRLPDLLRRQCLLSSHRWNRSSDPDPLRLSLPDPNRQIMHDPTSPAEHRQVPCAVPIRCLLRAPFKRKKMTMATLPLRRSSKCQ